MANEWPASKNMQTESKYPEQSLLGHHRDEVSARLIGATCRGTLNIPKMMRHKRMYETIIGMIVFQLLIFVQKNRIDLQSLAFEPKKDGKK